MKRIAKTLSFLIIGATFCGFTLSQPSTETFAINKRQIINVGILVKFADSEDLVSTHIDDEDSLHNAEALLNSDEPIKMQTTVGEISVPSIKKYYETQSYGKLSIITKFFVYQDKENMNYYLKQSDANPNGYSDETQQLARETELVENAINGIQAEIAQSNLTSSMLDSNNDGKIDMLTLFIEDTHTPASDLLHPHFFNNQGKINISTKIFDKPIAGHTIIYHTGDIQKYGTFSLNTGRYDTIAHELGHALGFPDLYRTSENGQPVGYYDLMAKNTPSNPQNLSAYLVSEYSTNTSWHNPLEVITRTTANITVSKPQFADPNEKRAIKIQLNNSRNEYFIVEYYEPNDARGEFYTADTKGIIIYRIDTSGNSDRVFVFRPNEPSLGAGEGNLSQAPLNSSRPSLGKALSSNKAFDNQTIYYADGSNSGLIITVTNVDTSSVTFDVTFPEVVGDGSKQDPYQISSPTTFIYLMNSDTTGKYYIITKDLDFKDIDYPRLNFYGHLDGQNHTLSNITNTGAGVFDNLGDYNSASSVQNLKAANLIIKPNSIGGSLGGLAAAINNATVTNVHLLSGEVSNIKGLNTISATGGFAGNVDNKTTINNCSSALNISADTNAGGFIGLNQNATIIDSHATGKVTGNNNIGGFIGIQYITDENYNAPQNSTYDSKGSSLPAVGAAYDTTAGNKFVTVPNHMLEGITDNGAITTPDPEEPLPTETEILAKLKLTKKQGYLFGFNLGTSLETMRQSFTSIKGVSIISIQNNNLQTVATDIKLSLRIGTTTYNYILVLKGDVNGDGKIQATDYVKIRNHIMSKAQLTGASLQAADIDQDEKVQATDYVKVRNHIMGKSTINQN